MSYMSVLACHGQFRFRRYGRRSIRCYVLCGSQCRFVQGFYCFFNVLCRRHVGFISYGSGGAPPPGARAFQINHVDKGFSHVAIYKHAHIEIVAAFLVVNIFSLLTIAS